MLEVFSKVYLLWQVGTQTSPTLVRLLNLFSAHSPPEAVTFQAVQRFILYRSVWHPSDALRGPSAYFWRSFFFFFNSSLFVILSRQFQPLSESLNPDHCLLCSPRLQCLLWAPPLCCGPEGLQAETGVISHQVFCRKSRPCTAYCSASENCCFMYFVQLYS